METKQLGQTDLKLSKIGLGTWAIGGSGWPYGWGAQAEEDSIDTIRRALELGINWIDTAPVYGLGRAEETVGKAIKGLGSNRPLIATKCGLVWDDHKNVFGRLKSQSIRAEVEESLRRLQIDCIDLYQIHWPNPQKDIEEAWQTLSDLVDEGKIRYAGVCNFNVKQLNRIESIHAVASVQPPYSMLERKIEENLIPYCQEKKMGLIPYSPLQKGILTDKFTRKWVESLPEDDHRKTVDKRFNEPLLSNHLSFVGSLQPIAKKHGKSLAHLAVAWVLRRAEVTAVIVGARRPSQIEQIVQIGTWMLKPGDLDLIEKCYRQVFIR